MIGEWQERRRGFMVRRFADGDLAASAVDCSDRDDAFWGWSAWPAPDSSEPLHGDAPTLDEAQAQADSALRQLGVLP